MSHPLQMIKCVYRPGKERCRRWASNARSELHERAVTMDRSEQEGHAVLVRIQLRSVH